MSDTTGLIVFCRSDGTHQQLCTVYPDGTSITPLTSDTNNYNWCRWSPDGTKILAGDTSNRLWVFQANGTLIRQLTNIASSSQLGFYQGDWSPDGTQCVVTGTITGSGGSATADVQIVNVDNSGHTAVTLSTKWSMFANSIISWSPDGTKFIYPSKPGAGMLSAIVCHVDGSSPVVLLDASGSTYNHYYIPWRWFPDSVNALVCEQQDLVSGASRLLKSDGTTTTTIHAGSDVDATSTLGAMSPDASHIVWNNTAATGLRTFIASTSGSFTTSGAVSSDGLDYKDLSAPPLLKPGIGWAGTPQQGWRRA